MLDLGWLSIHPSWPGSSSSIGCTYVWEPGSVFSPRGEVGVHDVPDGLRANLRVRVALDSRSTASFVPIPGGPLAEMVTEVRHGTTELPESYDDALDRVHAAMILQERGHTNCHRRLISAEEDRGPGLLLLANALSALYPRGSQGKRHVGRHVAGRTRLTCDV